MSIKGVVFDVSGTLLQTTGPPWPKSIAVPQPGVEEMLDALKALGLTIVAVSNDPVRAPLQGAGLLNRIDHVLERSDVGKAKGSTLWIDKFRELTGFEPHQLFYVGDSDHDMFTASWGPMIYAHAVWSCPPGQYGLKAPSPTWVVNVVEYIFRKEHPWYWTLQTTDGAGRAVRAMTLIDADGAGRPQVKQRLIWLLKDDIDSPIPTTPMTLREFVMLHMLASVYHSNLFGGSQFWTTYPGRAGVPNTIMGDFLNVAAKLSRSKYADDLLIRHTPAQRSRDARHQGGIFEALRNQLETMNVGEEYRKKIKGKRILLLDNFLTMGFTTEGGRTLLLAANAAEVVVACVGKYGPTMYVTTPPNEHWDPFARDRPAPTSFGLRQYSGTYHPEALDEFAASLEAIRNAAW